MSTFYLVLLIYGLIATPIGFYFKGVERGRQIREEEGGARS